MSTFDQWLRAGIDAGWCVPPVCNTHDGTPITDEEDHEFEHGGDPCVPVLRLCHDHDEQQNLMDNNTPLHYDKQLATLTTRKRAHDMQYYWSGYGKQPHRAHDGDAGFDLSYHGNEPLVIAPHTTTNIPTGIRVALPMGMWAMVTGRSSTFQRGLLTPLSIIDNGYRGDLFAIVHNIGDQPQTIVPGERIAQLIPMQLNTDGVEWHHLDELPTDTSRGTNGFGSSGQL